MDLDGIGYARHLKAERERILANVPAAHRARIMGRPLPSAESERREAKKVEDPTKPFRAEIALLKEELAETKRENGRLTMLLRELSRPMIQRIEPPMSEVMQEFCRVMNDAGRDVAGEPWGLTWLKTKRRIHPISHPRHVAIWLVREICPSPSSPMIGAAFGGKDHTTILYACQKAPGIMDADPGLRHVAISVLRKFGVNTAPLERGGEP